ncbi:MAG: MarC family protein [Pseudomonadota bacterium]
MLREIITFSLMCFSAVFFVVDPFAAVPMFLAMTPHDSADKRRRMALRAALAAGVLLTAFALVGALIFKALGITIGAFKIAGGILLLLMAIDMLRTRTSPTRITEGEVQDGAEKDDIAIVPLAMPMLAGPGSIATVIVLMGRARAEAWWQVIPVLAAILLTALLSYLVLLGAARVDRVLGRTGMNILSRVAGLLLAAIAVQFMLDGLVDGLGAVLVAPRAAPG